jgi:hypothetical protein
VPNSNSRKRPLGFSIIAAVLALLAISGFLNAFVWSRLRATLPPEASPHLRVVVNVLASPAVSAAAILYAITALCAAVGVWRMRAWAPPAILAWGVSVLILGGIFLVLGPHMVRAPFSSVVLAYAGLGAITIVIVGAMWSYVRRKVSHVDL